MSLRMKHNPTTPKLKEIFVGPPAPEQKPSLCSRCGKPVGYRYRVYAEHTDWKTGQRVIDQGQYEVAHISITGQVIWTCELPGLLDELKAKIEERIAAGEGNQFAKSATSAGKSSTVHRIKGESDAPPIRVVCGAKGSLLVSLDNEDVTCSNCRVRLQQIRATPATFAATGIDLMSATDDDDDDELTTTTIEPSKKEKVNTMAMTKAEIAAKAAAARANKAGAAAGAGVALADEAPMPKATVSKGPKKAQVAAPAKNTGPKLLNLCGCGCGAAVKSRFQPGHDAKLHGWIKKLERGAMALAEIPGMVRDGMFKGAKQAQVKGADGNVTLTGVVPTTSEEQYLEFLKGKGGSA